MKKLLSGMPEKPNCSQLALPAISVSLFDNDEDVAKYVQLHTATACIQEEKWWSKVMDANQMQMTSMVQEVGNRFSRFLQFQADHVSQSCRRRIFS